MTAVAADTHAAIWSLFEPALLSRDALAALSEAEAAGDPIYLTSISLVETWYLVERRRVAQDTLERLVNALSQPGATFVLIPLNLRVALAVGAIPRTEVPEMPDRIIAATALHLGVPLVTRDRRVRSSRIATIW